MAAIKKIDGVEVPAPVWEAMLTIRNFAGLVKKREKLGRVNITVSSAEDVNIERVSETTEKPVQKPDEKTKGGKKA